MQSLFQISLTLSLALLSTLTVASPLSTNASTSYTCHCIPGDACWPSDSQWASLNATISGRVIKTVPLGHVCHDPTYDAVACAALQVAWVDVATHYSAPADMMEPYFQNGSCTPFTPEAQPCVLGYYADYSINVSTAADVVAGLAFAEKNNIRITIKNTGHDYLGRSSGQGSLSLWTHNLKDISFSNYTSAHYTGPAAKLGAGVQAFEAYNAAYANGVRVVGGECPTVGLSGGYTQGGGHSALSSIYGLGADQTLEWEVVTANGSVVTASPSQNAELYWALSGGGPGNYGIVLSLTVKAHLEGVVGGALISYTSTNITADNYWLSYTALHTALPALVDKGIMVAYEAGNVSSVLVMEITVTYPNSTVLDVTTALQPFLTELASLGIVYVFTPTSFPSYHEHFSTYFESTPDGVFPAGQPTGGHLLPRSIVTDPTSVSTYTAAMREIMLAGNMGMFGVGLNVNHTIAQNTPSSNAVLPAWRTTISHLVIAGLTDYDAPIEDQRDAQQKITDVYLPILTAAINESGAYMNEADFQEQNWKEDFYGDNYDTLLAVKDIWDPSGLFFVQTGVGSDAWVFDEEGRLCRA